MTKHGRRPHPNKPDGRTLESEIRTMTAREIGEKYGVSEGTIWRWIRESRNSLEEQITSEQEEE